MCQKRIPYFQHRQRKNLKIQLHLEHVNCTQKFNIWAFEKNVFTIILQARKITFQFFKRVIFEKMKVGLENFLLTVGRNFGATIISKLTIVGYRHCLFSSHTT